MHTNRSANVRNLCLVAQEKVVTKTIIYPPLHIYPWPDKSPDNTLKHQEIQYHDRNEARYHGSLITNTCSQKSTPYAHHPIRRQ
jgi:hypothetical protein